MIFLTNHQTAVILEPGKQPLHLPPFFITPQHVTVLGGGLVAVASMRSDQINVAFIGQLLVQLITVVSLVANDCVRNMFQKTGIQRLLNERYFMRLSTGCVSGDKRLIRLKQQSAMYCEVLRISL